MSASSKKKLRKEQKAAAMSERQQREKKEAKSVLKLTVVFVVIMALMLGVFLYLGIPAAISTFDAIVDSTGILQKNTVSLTVNDHKITTAELNYFFLDSVRTLYNDYYNSYGEYASLYMQFMLGLNPAQALDKQVMDPETGDTWADYFTKRAISDAKYYYALYDDAIKNGYELSAEKADELNATLGTITYTAQMNKFSNENDFIRASYGYGASYDTYKRYIEVLTLAQSYASDHNDALTYESADLRAYEADKAHEFNSYTFASYQISYANFLGEGTKDEDGNTTYTDEQTAAALAEAKAAAESLKDVKSVEELDAAIAQLAMNAGAEEAPTSTKNVNMLYSNLNDTVRDWVASADRQENDVAVLPYTVTDENGEETTSAYIVVIFQSKSDNNTKMGDVRHYLVAFEGGTTDSTTGQTVYSEIEKDKAKTKAQEILDGWKADNPTEESFIELVKNGTADTASKTTGGLYENINYDSSYVTNFKNWAIDASRVAGETGLVETEYGYHIMYYVGDSKLNYRDYMIENAVREADQTARADGILKAATFEEGNTDRLTKNYIIEQS